MTKLQNVAGQAQDCSFLTLEVDAAVLEPVEELLGVVGGVALAIGGHHEDGHRVPLQLFREGDTVAVFIMATYGEGDRTDNAQKFLDLFKETKQNNKL